MDLFGKMAGFLGGKAGILALPEQLGGYLISGPIRARPAKETKSPAVACGLEKLFTRLRKVSRSATASQELVGSASRRGGIGNSPSPPMMNRRSRSKSSARKSGIASLSSLKIASKNVGSLASLRMMGPSPSLPP
jgi:hypothetical protein